LSMYFVQLRIAHGDARRAGHAGKVRVLGCSNETSWGLMKSIEAAKAVAQHTIRPSRTISASTTAGSRMNWLRSAGRKVSAFIPYSPIGGGVLAGKYDGGARRRRTVFQLPCDGGPPERDGTALQRKVGHLCRTLCRHRCRTRDSNRSPSRSACRPSNMTSLPRPCVRCDQARRNFADRRRRSGATRSGHEGRECGEPGNQCTRCGDANPARPTGPERTAELTASCRSVARSRARRPDFESAESSQIRSAAGSRAQAADLIITPWREWASAPACRGTADALADGLSTPNPFFESWFLLPSLARFDPEGKVRGCQPVRSRRT